MAKGKTMIQRQQQFLRVQLILLVLGVTLPLIALLIGGFFV